MCRTERIESHLVSQNGRRLSCSFIGCCQPIRTQVPNQGYASRTAPPTLSSCFSARRGNRYDARSLLCLNLNCQCG